MKVTIYGSGYVGLVTGACLADVGHHVLCVDIDTNKIARIQQGDIPIYEPGLEQLIANNVQAGRLAFSADPKEGVAYAMLQFIAVGTPADEDGSADLRYVCAAAKTIATHMQEEKIIISKSTVPVGTCDRIRAWVSEELQARNCSWSFDVASNPEFLKEGCAIDDFMKPDRIIIGVAQARTAEILQTLYAPFQRNCDRLMVMDVRAAEFTKYAANVMLATKISLMNEFANLAEHLQVDIEQVRKGIGADPRIGYHFIYPGCGYGGSCFPKDVKALIASAKQSSIPVRIMQAVEDVNERQKKRLFEKVYQHFNGDLAGKTIALWGLAFKPKTDDMREAPSRVLMEALWQHGVMVRAYDPAAMTEVQRIYGDSKDLVLCDDMIQAVQGADALVLVTEWHNFRSPDWAAIKAQLRHAVVFDGRNIYDPNELRAQGFVYYGIGRGT